MIRRLIVCLLLSAAGSYGTPTAPQNVVFLPTFLTGYDSLSAGTGFIVRLKNESLLLTAHHLFGTAAGLERDLSPKEAREYAVAVAASSMNQTSNIIVSSDMLLIQTAKPFDVEHGAADDVAGYRLEGYTGPALAIAEKAPIKGETIYLYARPRGENQLRMIPATVLRITSVALEFRYHEKGFDLGGTSGAPILNEKGEVVGLNVSGGESKGVVYGLANPATAFLQRVRTALAPQ